MGKEVVFTWKNLILTGITFMMSIMIPFGTMAYYFKGVYDTKFEYIEMQMQKTPSNAMLIEYFHLVDERFRSNETLDKLHYKQQADRINRMEQRFLSSGNRSGNIDVDYTDLQGFLWDNKEWDFLCDFKIR